MDATHLVEQPADFGCRQDHGQLLVHAGSGDLIQPWQLDVEDPAIQEEQRRAGLGLGRGGDMAVDRQVTQKVADLARTEILGVLLPMKENESSNPVRVRLLGPVRVVEGADGVTDLVKETDSASRRGRFDARGGLDDYSGYKQLLTSSLLSI